MKKAPIPKYEQERLELLQKLGILDTKPERRFDLLIKEAVERLQVPIATISIIDSKREWYKSSHGLSDKEGDRATSFCGHALLTKVLFVIEDTLKDDRFADNPSVIGEPFIRFYAGMALFHRDSNLPIAVFCIKDKKPRTLSSKEIQIFIDIASRAEEGFDKKL
ncbi:MAG: GAF domain-containing protein [Parcubacteria group bacterium]|nr:GAF domain-containing protein [Parcubacteria group bacterium]